ncbi:MAG: hypothetical protein AAF495_14775 [Pseudomonadota bacterium]
MAITATSAAWPVRRASGDNAAKQIKTAGAVKWLTFYSAEIDYEVIELSACEGSAFRGPYRMNLNIHTSRVTGGGVILLTKLE